MRPANDQRLLTDTQLLQHTAAGNEAAFQELFTRYRLPLFQFILKITKSTVDAEDILQDVFSKIWQQSANIAQKNDPRPYIHAIARNAAFDFLKNVAKNQHLTQQLWVNTQSLTNPEVEALIALREQQEIIRSTLEKLSPARREIYRMSREEYLNLDQIASRMGLSRSRAKNLLVESLKHVREALTEYSVMTTLLLATAQLLQLAQFMNF